MLIRDRIFGEHEITSPVLLELLASVPLQRLKGICQAGQPLETDPRPYRFTRYDHSVGVMLLLKILGATEEEQIAGLLHDVSHTAFSHTIDFVLERGKAEDFQDSQHERFILESSIPAILEKYHYSVERIYDYHHFTLLERGLPHLCADRVDYSLRESSKKLTDLCLSKLSTYKGVIIFTDEKVALAFARGFLLLQETSWGGEEHVIRERIFAKILRLGLSSSLLSLEDLWQDDKYVLDKLSTSSNTTITSLFEVMKQPSFAELPLSDVVIQKKFRYVDPDVQIGKKVMPLSTIDTNFQLLLEEAKKKNEKGICLPKLVVEEKR